MKMKKKTNLEDLSGPTGEIYFLRWMTLCVQRKTPSSGEIKVYTLCGFTSAILN